MPQSFCFPVFLNQFCIADNSGKWCAEFMRDSLYDMPTSLYQPLIFLYVFLQIFHYSFHPFVMFGFLPHISLYNQIRYDK